MTYLLSLAVLSLFTPLKIATGLAQIRPFDALTLLALGWALSRGRIFPRGGLHTGFLILLPYLAWHVVSALGVSLPNGMREGLQVLTVVAFAWAVSGALDEIDYRLMGRLLVIGMIIVTAWSIGWHIANGYWTGWKRLNDPKATFTFLPLLLACLLIAREGDRRGLYWLAWGVLGAVILQSGERKALIVVGILSAALIARGRLLSSLHVVGGAVVVLVLLSGVIEDRYLARQIQSVVDPFDQGDFSTAIATGEAADGDSRSNAQRGFALALAEELIFSHLLFGVGTNEYERIINVRYAYLPDFMRNGIHGEFLRVLTENGLVGFVSYCAVWLFAAVRTRMVLRGLVLARQLRTSQAALLQIAAFVPCLLYVSFEASGTHSIVVLIFISLLPEGLTAWYAHASHRAPVVAVRPAVYQPRLRPQPITVRRMNLGRSR